MDRHQKPGKGSHATKARVNFTKLCVTIEKVVKVNKNVIQFYQQFTKKIIQNLEYQLSFFISNHQIVCAFIRFVKIMIKLTLNRTLHSVFSWFCLPIVLPDPIFFQKRISITNVPKN